MNGGGPKCIGGIAYYLVPPYNITDIFYNPSNFIIYIIFIISSCAQFSKLWLDISGRSLDDMVRQLKDVRIFLSNKKEDSMHKVLNQKIPVSAIFGGIYIGI